MVQVALKKLDGSLLGYYQFIVVPRTAERIRVQRSLYQVLDVLHEPGVGVTLTVQWTQDL